MHCVRIHRVIDQMISMCRHIGLWHDEDDGLTFIQFGLKSFYCVYYILFSISFAIGTISSETVDEGIFIAELSTIIVVLTVKIWLFLWKQKKIVRMLDRLCVFSIRNDEEFAFFNDKVEKFNKFVIAYVCGAIIGSLGCSGFPFIGKKKTFVVDFAFPLDYKNSEIGFWTANIFFTTENGLSFVALAFSITTWYLLLHCSLRYKILGMEIRKMGRVTVAGEGKMTETQKQKMFHQDLVTSIEAHLHLRGVIDEVESFLSKLFLLQFATSCLCICGSIYCLAFVVGVNFVERIVHVYSLFYYTAELFIVTYFGNEIMLSSDCLTYSLFESEWIGQPHSTQTDVIIFGEYLKRSHEILIGKLYPLTLETFTRILNASYSLFNILKTVKR
ncbi:odorant receptor 30a-like [Bradysia coprophila]|uniref:odorant receptor 30a-like n=1 Tax=Bradysia coprophila TaxID=38358 RepID=UPI00187DBFEE|nr:odorant receptor 30a-like [Bradysia coprophila]